MLGPIVTVTGSFAVVTVWPDASWSATTTSGLKRPPAVASPGCAMNASLAGGGDGATGWFDSLQAARANPPAHANTRFQVRVIVGLYGVCPDGRAATGLLAPPHGCAYAKTPQSSENRFEGRCCRCGCLAASR